MIDVKFTSKPGFTAVGLAGYYTMDETDQIGDLWSQFIPRINEPEGRLGDYSFGICDLPEEMPEGKDFRYVACVEVQHSETNIPEGMVRCNIEEHDYAVFTHKGSLEKLGDTYDYIHNEWLPGSEYDAPLGEFELYDERFNCENPMSDDSELDIYVAIERKGE